MDTSTSGRRARSHARPARRDPIARHREAVRLRRFHATRDPSLRDDIVRAYLPLARSVARRYRSDRVAPEDLDQVAAIGLLKALDRYDPARGVAFSSFAVPTILGEVQRYFRDFSWSVRPPRGLQELAMRLESAESTMRPELGRAPTARELAARLDMSLEEVVDGLHARRARDGVSLNRPWNAAEDEGATLGDSIGRHDDGYERAEAAATLERLLPTLDDRDRRILQLRFDHDLTQREIGEIVGCSQMHVSRLIRAALA